MGDAVALSADRWVAEQHVLSRELVEEGAVALAHHDRYEAVRHPTGNRSGLLCVVSRRRQPEELVESLPARSFVTSARGDYLRLAPHFFFTDEEIGRLAEVMNELG